MPDLDVRRATVGTRREGRRCHSAYGSHARGIRLIVGDDRVLRVARAGRPVADAGREVADWSAGIALALMYPLVRRVRRAGGKATPDAAIVVPQLEHEGTDMRKMPSIQSLETVSCEEAQAYLDHARGDELSAAYALACDRNRLDGSIVPPDNAEVHHALFLLCRAQGKNPPSFDQMRVDLRRRVAA
jgi:uncharacterized protein (DUF1810 family)